MVSSKSSKVVKGKKSNNNTRKNGKKIHLNLKEITKILPNGNYSINGNYGSSKKYPNGIKVKGHTLIKPNKHENKDCICITTTIHAYDALSNNKLYTAIRKSHIFIENNKFHKDTTSYIDDKIVSHSKGTGIILSKDQITFNSDGIWFILGNDKIHINQTYHNINGKIVSVIENKDKSGNKLNQMVSILVKK